MIIRKGVPCFHIDVDWMINTIYSTLFFSVTKQQNSKVIGLFSNNVTALITGHSDSQYIAEALVLVQWVSNLIWENTGLLTLIFLTVNGYRSKRSSQIFRLSVIGQNNHLKFFGYWLLVRTTTSNFSVIGYISSEWNGQCIVTVITVMTTN